MWEVLAVWPWAVDPLQTALGTNQPSNSLSASLTLHSLLTASCSPAACCRGSPARAQLLRAALLPVPAPGERSGPFLQSEACPAASPLSSGIWGEASATAGVGGADPPPELQPSLSGECPPFCLEGQVG